MCLGHLLLLQVQPVTAARPFAGDPNWIEDQRKQKNVRCSVNEETAFTVPTFSALCKLLEKFNVRRIPRSHRKNIFATVVMCSRKKRRFASVWGPRPPGVPPFPAIKHLEDKCTIVVRAHEVPLRD